MKLRAWVWWVVSGLCLMVAPASAADAEWPQWRGPDGQGHAAARHLPLNWDEDQNQNIRWRTEVAGRAWSSPVVEAGIIWMTTATDVPTDEAEREQRLVGNTNSQPLHVADRVSLRAVGIRRDNGELLHDIELLVKDKPQPIHTLNSYASPTPVIEQGRLYCHFGTYGTACLDTTNGRVLWTNCDLQIQHENGPGSSPVLWRDLLIFHCDGSDEQYIVALHKQTGKVAWKTDRTGSMDPNPQLKKAYGTPLIVTVDGRELLLSTAANWLYAYDPADGREMWKLPYGVLGFSIASRPVTENGMLYFSTCFMRAELLAVRLEGPQGPEIVWRSQRQVPQMPSPLLVDGLIYMVNDKGIATCLDAQTGELVWTERLGGNFSSSPLYADGRIYVGNREGVTYVLAPGRQFQVLAKNQLDGEIFASPAALGDELLIRTDKALYCIGQKKQQD